MNSRIPMFIEVIEKQEHAAVQICRKAMAVLFKHKIAPLPLAGSLSEFHLTQKNLGERGLKASIFVANAYWAEELLASLLPSMESAPLLIFNRRMFSSETTVGLRPQSKRDLIGGILRQKGAAHVSVWDYGSRNADEVAQRAAESICLFLADGDFEHIRAAQPDLAKSASAAAVSVEVAPAAPAPVPPPVVPSPAPAAPVPPPLDSAGVFLERNMRTSLAAVKAPRPSAPAPASAAPPPIVPVVASTSMSGLHGTLSQMSIASLLTTLDMEKKSGVLSIMRDGVTGQLLLLKGRVVNAQMMGPGVPDECRAGPECVYRLLTWHNGLFNFVTSDINVVDDIRASTTQLLMEAARRSDEPAGQLT